jgi:hypothetical protein
VWVEESFVYAKAKMEKSRSDPNLVDLIHSTTHSYAGDREIIIDKNIKKIATFKIVCSDPKDALKVQKECLMSDPLLSHLIKYKRIIAKSSTGKFVFYEIELGKMHVDKLNAMKDLSERLKEETESEVNVTTYRPSISFFGKSTVHITFTVPMSDTTIEKILAFHEHSLLKHLGHFTVKDFSSENVFDDASLKKRIKGF